VLEPHSEGTYRVLIRVSEGVNPPATFEDPLRLIRLAWLLVTADCLSCDFSRIRVLLNYYTSGVADIGTEELLTHGDQAHTS
jgi:hypothetical protein